MKYTILHLLFCLSYSLQAQIEYSSHRGSSLHAPENTIAAVTLAWEQNADAVEIDVHLSKDNKLMVIHDGTTKRTTGQEYRVQETSSELLRSLDVGSFKGAQYKGERMPFLNEIIDLTPVGKKLYIELKCGLDALPYLKEVIDMSPKGDRLAIICFNFDVLVAAKKMFPDLRCHLLIGKEEKLKENIQKASQNGIDFVDLKHSLITQDIVTYVHGLSMGVNAWTVDDPKDAKRLAALQVNGIETNCVPCLKEAMNKEG